MTGALIAYFNETVATTHEPMLQLAASITHDPHLARDACQEAYLEFFLALNRRTAIANRGAWLRRVVINKALAVVRRRKAAVGAPLDALDGLEPAVAEDAADEGTATALRGALAAMSPEERRLIALRMLDGLTYREIAARLDCPLSTVRGRVNRALLALHARLGRDQRDDAKP